MDLRLRFLNLGIYRPVLSLVVWSPHRKCTKCMVLIIAELADVAEVSKQIPALAEISTTITQMRVKHANH